MNKAQAAIFIIVFASIASWLAGCTGPRLIATQVNSFAPQAVSSGAGYQFERLPSRQVVFESHASHEGVWSDSDAILAAMFDAALQGFPAPPAGVRRVNIEIPR